MAAAALLRSVARACAPHPLARGLRDGARSGPGAGLRSGAGLPSLARKKIARAPPQGYRGLHSSTSPNPGASGSTPPISDKEDLPIRLSFSRALVSTFGVAAVYLSFWELPEDNILTHAIKELESTIDIDEHEEDLQSSGHGETRVDQSEVDRVLKFFPVLKEIADNIKDLQATSEAMQVTIKDHQAATAELRAVLESVLTEGELKELLNAEKIEMVNQNMLELLLASELPALESALPEGERKGVAE